MNKLAEERLNSLLFLADEMDANGWKDDAEALRELLAAHSVGAMTEAAISLLRRWYEAQSTGRIKVSDAAYLIVTDTAELIERARALLAKGEMT